jgi:hypothetical protein
MVCFKLKVLDMFKANLTNVINFIENNYSTLLESIHFHLHMSSNVTQRKK